MGLPPGVRLLPLAALLAAVQVGGSFGAAGNQPERRALDAVAVALLLVGPAVVPLRRWPHLSVVCAFAAAAAFLGRGHPYGPVLASCAVTLFLAGLTERRARTLLVALAGATALLAAHVVDPRRQGGLPWVHAAVVLGWLAAVVAIAEVVRGRREQAAERARLQAEDERRRAGEQRLRVAQELHDVLAHDISMIHVQAGVALHLLDDQPEHARTALASIKEASRDALQELRAALEVLRRGDAAPRAPAPRLAELPALLDAVRAGGLDVRLHAAELPPLPAPVELAAYRIVQEALTNVTRHARATTATVSLRADDVLEVEVQDDGRGGTAVPGNGLAGMRERAAALGGTVDAGPTRGRGFKVAARLPLRL